MFGGTVTGALPFWVSGAALYCTSDDGKEQPNNLFQQASRNSPTHMESKQQVLSGIVLRQQLPKVGVNAPSLQSIPHCIAQTQPVLHRNL